MTTVIPWSLSLFLWFNATTPTKESLYIQATRMLHQKKYAKAAVSLRRVLPILKQEKAATQRNSQAWHLLTLGQAYTLRQLAKIAWRQGQTSKACLFNQALQSYTKTLPANWKSFASAQLQREILAAKQQLKGACTQVASTVLVRTVPPKAVVSLRTEEKWAVQTSRTLTTTRAQLRLRVTALGYQALEQNVKIARWKQTSVTLRLKRLPKPKPQLVSIRPTPVRPTSRKPIIIQVVKKAKPTPFYKTWWFWTLTGVVVAGATTAGVLAATSQPRHVLNGEQGGLHRLW